MKSALNFLIIATITTVLGYGIIALQHNDKFSHMDAEASSHKKYSITCTSGESVLLHNKTGSNLQTSTHGLSYINIEGKTVTVVNASCIAIEK